MNKYYKMFAHREVFIYAEKETSQVSGSYSD